MHTHKYKSILKHRHTHTHIHLHRGWRHACRGLSCVRLSLFLFTVFYSFPLPLLLFYFATTSCVCFFVARHLLREEKERENKEIAFHTKTYADFYSCCFFSKFLFDGSFSSRRLILLRFFVVSKYIHNFY